MTAHALLVATACPKPVSNGSARNTSTRFYATPRTKLQHDAFSTTQRGTCSPRSVSVDRVERAAHRCDDGLTWTRLRAPHGQCADGERAE